MTMADDMSDPEGPIDGHPVHPALAIIPLMTELEFEGLTHSIKRSGLYDPIVLIGETIIDGRCRLIACRRAGVEPRFKQMPERWDPVDYVVSANLLRVHDGSPGRKAMRSVMLAGDHADQWQADGDFAGHPPELIEIARVVRASRPGAVPNILSGGMSLDEVYRRILEDRRVHEWNRQILARLRAEAPSIADLVDTAQMTLTEGVALHRSRLVTDAAWAELELLWRVVQEGPPAVEPAPEPVRPRRRLRL
jgi:ParB-like nuclease family protein